jgi:hypothetical protein
VTVERSGGSATRTIPLPGPAEFERTFVDGQLEASETRAVLHLRFTGCSGHTCEERGVLYDEILTWELDHGDFLKLTGCNGRSACAADACAGKLGPADVSGEVVAYSDCVATHVRDFAPAAVPAGRDYAPAPGGVRVAGSFLARATFDDARHDHPRARVSNWRTGEELYSMPNAYQYDIQDDGKLAFGAYDVSWASPAEPTAHPARDRWPIAVRAAGDRVAVSYDAGLTYLGLDVEVARLDGSEYSADIEVPWIHDPWADGEAYDFDGERVARVARVCLRSWIIVQNVGEVSPPPGVVEANCSFPRVVPGSGWLDRGHRLRLRLTCPSSPDIGCAGDANTRGRHPDEFGDHVQKPYAIRAGAEKTIKLKQRPKPLCRTRNGLARARVTFSVYDHSAGGIRAPLYYWIGRTVRARGHTRGLPRCA